CTAGGSAVRAPRRAFTVTVALACPTRGSVRLPPALQKELEDASDEAEQEDGISAEEIFAELRKHG
nr:hypothetical protein [Rubrivivax sp.]